jgi:hypothetical protein
MWLDYLLVALFGGLVGVVELVSRYRDAPMRATLTITGLVYVAVNLLSSVAALALARLFGWNFGFDPSTQDQLVRWSQVIAAGFGAMLLFRTSLFTVRSGEEDVGVGLNSLLKVILDAADRAVGRTRAKARALTVAALMEGKSFAKAKDQLPTVCIAMIPNFPPEEGARLKDRVKLIDGAALPHKAKLLTLGLTLVDSFGENVLRAAVESLGDDILTASAKRGAKKPSNERS